MDMGAGWRVANERLLSILGYALIMATVGMILRLIFKPIGRWGNFVAPALIRITAFTFVGLAWNLVPYLVVPVLIAENPGSFPAIQHSSALITQRWGEDVVVNASVWLVFELPLLVVLVLGGPAIGWAFINLSEWRITWVVYIVTMLVLLTFLFKMAMDANFAAVTYRYATTGEVHGYFYEEDLQLAYINRPSRMVNAVRSCLDHKFRLFRRRSTSLPVDNGANAASMAPPMLVQEHIPDPPEKEVYRSDGT
jgi:hypothetical protein